MNNKRRRTSSDIETDDSDDSEEQFASTPAVRKRKKLDPVSFLNKMEKRNFLNK